jgi:energy-coupling factor transport system ATP-binding protein
MMNAIEVKDLSWRYERAESFALENLNLIIEENKFIGIVGPNEAGKTTLVSAIKGIIPSMFNGIYKGSVEVFGKKVTDCSSRELAKTVGMVFADPDSQFTSMSVEEEISFGLENIGCTVEEIAERIEWVSELTNIGELLEKPPYDLSGGQKQRVAIASIIAMKPKIIILDEPTSMLDPISKDMVFNLLETMKKNLNLTIIVVEHNIEKLIELSDMMILINDGKIEKYTKTEDFFEDLDFLDSRSIRVPGAIRFINMIEEEEMAKKPVYLNEIAERIKVDTRRRE